MFAISLLLGGLAAADPSLGVQTRVVREYQENGQTRVQEFAPHFRFSEKGVQVGDQTLTRPTLPDEAAQKMFSTLLEMFATQASPMLSRLQQQQGQPLEIRLEIPTLKEKLTIQVTPQAEP
jgi:hypothetical protein